MSSLSRPAETVVNPSRLAHLYSFRDLGVVGAFALTVLMVFVNSADFQGADADSFSVKYQIYIRILVCGLCGLYGVLFLQSSLSRFLKFPGLLVVAYGAVVLMSVPISIDRTYSGVTAICLWCLFLFLPAALDKIGNLRFLIAIATGAIAYVLVSWFLYLMVPSLGISREFVSEDVFLERMGGLGHPNTLGLYASVSLLMILLLIRQKILSWKWVLPCVVLWAATIYLCLSRTSVILAGVGALGIFWDRIWRVQHLPRLIALALGGTACLLIYAATGDLTEQIENTLLSVSKSGEVSELTSATGRVEIWAHALQKIDERLLTGFGYGTQRFVMHEHSYHCHNIVLNAMLGCGIFAGLLVISFLCLLVRRLWMQPDPVIRAFVPLFLIGGMVESLIYSPAPSLEMVLFFLLIYWQDETPQS